VAVRGLATGKCPQAAKVGHMETVWSLGYAHMNAAVWVSKAACVLAV